MDIKIQNVLTGKKEVFEPVNPDKLSIYVCGVTVYGRCHVGHLRCYLSFDSILRYFNWNGVDVKYVRNFTDIDDKIIARAKEIEEGQEGEWRKAPQYELYDEEQWSERFKEDGEILELAKSSSKHLSQVVADYFIDAFRNKDFAPFDLFPAESEPQVSDYIPEVIDLIQKIIDNGFAYEVEGDVYFDVPAYHASTNRYGVLSRRDFTQLMEGARVSTGDKKRNGPDFALWKASREGEPYWESPWGNGRPGWHIECSAMSNKELGTPFDIHGGGKDLIFPHHENEIAQSEAGQGHTFCNTWIHNGFVTVDGVKMSKSLGNFIPISSALDMALPEVWRMVVLSSHYASPIDFSRTRKVGDDGKTVRGTIDIAYDRVVYFYETLKKANAVSDCSDDNSSIEIIDDNRAVGIVSRFKDAMNDDFNTAKAIASIGESMKYLNELCDMKMKAVKKLNGGDAAWKKT
ncbi:MAG: cysteine--tRNA ligase, partial [Deltaproteobacteria bacterium]|nr:cysteine--tRNA ligase [Deltaproteobacteria bacterium]